MTLEAAMNTARKIYDWIIIASWRIYHWIPRFIPKLYRYLVLRSAWTWTLFILLTASIGAFVIGKAAYAFANAGISPFIYFWDNWILPVYAQIEFQYIWWAMAVSLVIVLCAWVQPWKLHVRGGWRGGSITFVVSGLILFTIFTVLAWQLQRYITHSSWVFNRLESFIPVNWQWAHWLLNAMGPWWGVIWWMLIVTLFGLACWGFLFAFGLLKNITHRIATINRAYIRGTRLIIENEDRPLDVIFETSLYGSMVRQSLGRSVRYPRKFLQPILPRVMPIERFFSLFEKSAMLVLHYLSLAWIADRLFGKPYYSMHFEVVLDDLLCREHKDAWQALMEDYVHGALDTYAWDGLFAEDTGEAAQFGGGVDAGHRS